MATLNTLRTRAGAALSIVIGISLLAFLLGDMTSVENWINSGKTRAGKINGTSISYVEFLSTSENTTNVLEALYGKSSFTNEETDQIREAVWESMIIKNAYQPGFDRMGLVVGDAEMIDMTQGQYMSPVIQGVFANPQTGSFDKTSLKNFVASLEYNKDNVSIWNYLMEQMQNEREMSKFVKLVEAGIYVNNLEVENSIAKAGERTSAEYYAKTYASVSDSLVNVSKAEVKKYYSEHKKDYKQTASRDIEYVVFDMTPSESDYAEAKKAVDKIAAEFAVAEDPMQYAGLNSQVKTDSRYYRESELPQNYASLAFGNAAGTMYGPVLTGDVYTMARVSGVKMMPDTIGAKHILLESTKTATADSIITAIKGGASFEELAAKYSMDKRADLGRFTPDQMVSSFSDACVAANVGDLFTVTSQYGLHVVQLTYKSTPVRKAQIASVIYNVEPSSFTQQTVYGQARDFLEKAGKTYSGFDAAVAATGAARRTASVGNTQHEVNGLKDSRELVRWSFTGKKGDVSTILDVDGDYVIAAIKEAHEAGYPTFAEAYEGIRTKVMNNKKADYIRAQVADKDFAATGSVEGFNHGTIDSLSFASFMIPGIGMEPKVIGAVCTTPADKGATVNGNEGVYLYKVTSKIKVAAPDAKDERVRLEAMAQSYINERLTQALTDETKITDNRVKFF